MKKLLILLVLIFSVYVFSLPIFASDGIAPDIVFTFQQPSYLTDKNPNLSEFTCDTNESVCKVNFDLSSSFTGSFDSSDFTCLLDFGLGSITGQEAKCNPNTVIFTGSTDYTVHFKIINKTDSAIFSERILVIHSGFIQPDAFSGTLSDSGTLTDTGTLENSGVLDEVVSLGETGSLVSTGNISIVTHSGDIVPEMAPDILFTLQQPSYFTDKDASLPEFTCDTTKSNCSVNFDLTPSFTGSFHSSDFTCLTDFGLGSPTGEEGKCNPNTVIFTGSSSYSVHFQIIKKTDPSIFSERVITIHPGYPLSMTLSGALSDSGTLIETGVLDNSGTLSETETASTGAVILIADPEIVVQSGLDDSFKCTKTDCIVNLEYVPKDPKEMCIWDFTGGIYNTGTENHCNPGYIHYPIGEFRVVLRVFEQGNTSNYKEKILNFSNIVPIEIQKSSTYETNASASVINHLPIAIIKLQGNLGKTKVRQGSSIRCTGVEECSVNFSGEESYDPDKDRLMYHWNFGNGQTSDKANPPAIKYKTGEYNVVLQVTEPRGYSDETAFLVSVSGKDSKETLPIKLLDLNVFSLQVTGVNPNPEGTDIESEWVEITNPLDVDVSLNLCSFDDAPDKGSNPYIFPEDAIIRRESKTRYYRLQTHLNFNNSLDSATLICDGQAISSIIWDDNIPEDFIVTRENVLFETKKGKKLSQTLGGDTTVNHIDDTPEDIPFESIIISLQGLLSKNRKLTGNTFTCQTKTTCSINLTAGKTRKGTIYYWDFGNGEVFYGANPPSNKFPLGTHTIILKILDVKTGNIREEAFQVVVRKLVTVKKPKPAKIIVEKTEKPMIIRGKDYHDSSISTPSSKISPLQASASAGAIGLIFFGGVYGMIRRKSL